MYTLAGTSIFRTMRTQARARSRFRLPFRLPGAGIGLLALATLVPEAAEPQEKEPQEEIPPRPDRPGGPPARTPAPGRDRAGERPARGPGTPARPSGRAAVRGRESPAPARKAGEGSAGWKLGASARADLGYDTNVFQADRATGDAFTTLGFSASARREAERTRLSARLQANRRFYREFSRADEAEVFLDLAASRQVGAGRVGGGVSSSYLDLRVLDREGDFLPRSTFASFSSRAFGYAGSTVTRSFYVLALGSYRLKDYEETPDLESLDYGEWSAQLGVTRSLPIRFSLRLQGTLERRSYREILAGSSTGVDEQDNPELDLRRLQGEARLRKRWGRLAYAQAAFALRGSEDLFQDELSYRQRSGTFSLYQPIGRWRLDVSAALVGRDFDLRRSGTDEPLREDFRSVSAEIEGPLWEGAKVTGGWSLFNRATNDILGGYTVGTWRLGVTHAF